MTPCPCPFRRFPGDSFGFSSKFFTQAGQSFCRNAPRRENLARMANLRSKLRLTIGTKLVSLIALLLIGSVATLVWLSTRMFIEDNTALIQQMNADTATALSTRVRESFESVTNR